MNKTVQHVTQRIIERSKSKSHCLPSTEQPRAAARSVDNYPCSNLAHDLASCPSCRPTLLNDNKQWVVD